MRIARHVIPEVTKVMSSDTWTIYLSMKLFEIAHRHAPTQGLLQIALPHMRKLADDTVQSCNLGIHSAGRVLIIAQVESPAPFGISVRPGALFPMLPNAAGQIGR